MAGGRSQLSRPELRAWEDSELPLSPAGTAMLPILLFGLACHATQPGVGERESPAPLVLEVAVPTPPAPAPTPPEVKPSSPPDRWLLMKALQGTWPGSLLDDQRLSVSGWIDMSYTFSSANNNLPMGFNYIGNDFLLQQNWIRIDRPVVTSGTTEPTFGFRSDWILPGSDYFFTLPRGIFFGQLTANDCKPNRYGIDPIQFFVEAYFPNIAVGTDIKFGRIFCQYGVESNAAVDNSFLSHTYGFIYDPFTHTGLMATTKLTDTWTVQAGIMLGNDDFIDPVATPYSMGSLKWAPPGGRDSVVASFILGSGRFNDSRNFHNPEVLDLVYTHQFNPRLSYKFNALYGFTYNVPNIGFANWFSVVNYLAYDVTPRLSATTRFEFFDDVQGQRTGFPGLYTALTCGLQFRPRKSIIIRPEIRYDYNGQSRPFEDQHGLFTLASDLILRW